MTERSPNGASDEHSDTERSDHAGGDTERVAAEWAERLGRWVARTVARAKEDAEDIWAEAQALRRKL
jgi:hypothetical protein